jgi:WD40 repeat protein
VYDWRGELSDSAFLKLVGSQNHIVMHDGRQPSFHVIDIGSPNTPPLTRASTSRMQFTDAAFSPNGRWHATTTNDTTVTMWDTATWQPARRYGWKVGRLRAVAFAPDGLTCAAGSDSGKVVLFDVDG